MFLSGFAGKFAGKLAQCLLLACTPAILLVPPAALAQTEGPASHVLQQAFDRAWSMAPLARGLQARQEESQAALNAAASWLAGSPSVGLSQRFDQSSGGADVGFREAEVSISTPVWWPGQKSAREQLASNSAAELNAQTVLARLDLAGQVREAYWQLALAQENVEELEDHVKHLEDIARDVAKRVKAGDLARTDSLLAEQEVQHSRTQLTAAKAEAARQLASYRNLTALQSPAVFQAELMAQPNTGQAPADQPLADHPRLQSGRAALQKASAALTLANESRADNPSVGLSVRNERDDFSPNSRALGFHLQIPIGMDAKGKPLQAAANTQFAIAQAELKQQALAVANDIELARAALEFEKEALEQATQRTQLTTEHLALIDKAFRLGERGLNDLLRAQILSHEANSARSRQQIKAHQAVSRLNQAFGVFP